jgi:hypothetical protein
MTAKTNVPSVSIKPMLDELREAQTRFNKGQARFRKGQTALRKGARVNARPSRVTSSIKQNGKEVSGRSALPNRPSSFMGANGCSPNL